MSVVVLLELASAPLRTGVRSDPAWRLRRYSLSSRRTPCSSDPPGSGQYRFPSRPSLGAVAMHGRIAPVRVVPATG
jgi:hypothetical protein